MPKLLTALLAALLALPCLAAPDDKAGGGAKPPATNITERWYVFLLDGHRAGWMKSAEKTEGDRIITSGQVDMRIKRGPIALKVAISTEFTETLDGKPISMSSVKNMGVGSSTTSTTVFKGDTMEVTTVQGDQKTVENVPVPKGAWLPPAATERYIKQQLAAGATEMRYSTIDPEEGGVMDVTRRLLDKNAAVDVFGRTVPAVKWSNTIAQLKGINVVEYLNEAGETVKTDMDVGLAVTQLLADKELALSPMEAPELLNATMVSPSRRIADARTVRHAVYNLSATREDISDLPSVVGQTVTREGPNKLRITEDAAAGEPVAGDKLKAALAECLPPTPMLKADDPAIMKLVEEADVKGLPPAKAAERLRRFVYDYINKKDMSVGFASASEVARTRTGDCTEHAMLLAAMLRRAGIPSRVVSGLVYADHFSGRSGIFGYHMWTQALLKGDDGAYAWMNLDGTLGDDTPYDATHIILSTSTLAEGQMQNFMVESAPLIGRLKIDVVETK